MSTAAETPQDKGTSIWARYNTLLETNPLVTKSITAGVISLLGDLGCQIFIEGLEDHGIDYARTTKFTLLGGVMVGPVLHYWYSTLGRIITATGTSGTIYRLLADQFVFAPLFIPSVFAFLLTLEGRPDEIKSTISSEWWPTVCSNWMLWIPAQFVNFRLVPPLYQVLFANCVGFFWNIYLSFVSHR